MPPPTLPAGAGVKGASVQGVPLCRLLRPRARALRPARPFPGRRHAVGTRTHTLGPGLSVGTRAATGRRSGGAAQAHPGGCPAPPAPPPPSPGAPCPGAASPARTGSGTRGAGGEGGQGGDAWADTAQL